MDELSKTLCSSGYAKDNGVLFYHDAVYIRDDTPALALLEVRRVLGRAFVPVTLTAEAFDEMLARIWQQSSGVSQQLVDDMDADIDLMALTEEIPDNEDLLDNDENSPVIRLINAILGEAVKEGASDIHIETFERTLSIRFRVDGVLRPVLQPARKLAPLLVSRIKVMSRLDIAEKRLPQDGRISLRIGRKAVDVRVSTIPSQYGERVVMRLLDKSNLKPDINKLGLIDEEREKLQGLIDRPHGIILVTGPTGSGKSTTLYAILSALNGHERNILTVEDPIEYELEGVGQTQVNPRVDMTFARGLRAILRQDPDVVMIGEIRDAETAQIAVQASLTGHLVMSTLHTNSAAGAITRLRDMGLESFLIGSSLLGSLPSVWCVGCVRTAVPPVRWMTMKRRCSALWTSRHTRSIARWGANTAARAAIRGAPVFMNFWWSTAPCAAPFMKIKTKWPSKPSSLSRPTACVRTGC